MPPSYKGSHKYKSKLLFLPRPPAISSLFTLIGIGVGEWGAWGGFEWTGNCEKEVEHHTVCLPIHHLHVWLPKPFVTFIHQLWTFLYAEKWSKVKCQQPRAVIWDKIGKVNLKEKIRISKVNPMKIIYQLEILTNLLTFTQQRYWFYQATYSFCSPIFY